MLRAVSSAAVVLLCCAAIASAPALAQPSAAAAPAGAAPAGAAPAPTRAAYLRLAAEMDDSLQRHVLSLWFPRAVDRERGGFHQYFAEDWSRTPRHDRSIVYQSRLTWTSAQAAERYPAERARYLAYSRHGLDYLANRMWDAQHGGFFWAVDAQGRPLLDRGGEKHIYGNAFGLYAASTNYRVSRDPRALELARRAYAWLEAHAHDAENGGYHEAFTRDGRILKISPDPVRKADLLGTHYGYKSMNSHIHILEALTALYEVWPDPQLRVRLQEVFEVVRDRIVVDQAGAMNLYFTPDWRPVPDHDSFGHDVETAYLLVEAAGALGMRDDPKTWAVARNLVDHALEWGWDAENGGFFDAGGTFGRTYNDDKVWWTQAEGLNALLLMHTRYGAETPKYWTAFNQQWRFITRHQIDPVNRGWRATVSREGVASPGRAKSDAWTESYHQARALLNVSAGLRALAEGRVGGHGASAGSGR